MLSTKEEEEEKKEEEEEEEEKEKKNKGEGEKDDHGLLLAWFLCMDGLPLHVLFILITSLDPCKASSTLNLFLSMYLLCIVYKNHIFILAMS